MLALVTGEPPWKQAGLPCCHVTPVQLVSGYPMPCSDSAHPNHQHLMRQEGWRSTVWTDKSCPMPSGSRARLNRSHLMRVGEEASSGGLAPASA